MCVSWVQGEKRSRVQPSVIMECFNSLHRLYATSLSLLPSPSALPHPPRGGMSAFHTGPRGVCRPSHLSCSPSLRALCCAEILIRFFLFCSSDSRLGPPQDLLINVPPATVTTAGTDAGIGPCMPAQTCCTLVPVPIHKCYCKRRDEFENDIHYFLLVFYLTIKCIWVQHSILLIFFFNIMLFIFTLLNFF